MKTFKEYLGNPSVGIGPAADINKPMASLNSPHQFHTNKRYATTFSQYKGPGMGTIKPMLTAISDRLKSKVLQRKIDRAKAKSLSKKRLQQP